MNNTIDHELSKYRNTSNVDQTMEYTTTPDILLELIIIYCRVETIKYARKKKILKNRKKIFFYKP